MHYEKPEVVDLGSISDHTFGGWSFWKDCFNGGSPNGNYRPNGILARFWG